MNPFIPKKDANLVIVDGRIDEEIENSLKLLNLKIIKTVKCIEVDDSISYHPDIVMHPVNHNTLVIAPNVFDYYADKLNGMGINLIKGDKFLDRKYPEDIAYNVGRLSGVAIHNFKYTDKILKYYLEKENLNLININQGYSKCSLAIVSEDAAITSDYPMYKALSDCGYKILLVQPGSVLLKGQKYGFIGGVSGNISSNVIVISGILDDHPNKEDILNFLDKNNKNLVVLSQKKLVDIGTVIALYCH